MSDQLTIKVAKTAPLPIFNDQFEFSIGYGSDQFECGTFNVQTITETVTSYTIRATGVDYCSTLKKKRNESYENLRLDELVAQLADRNKLAYRCDFDHLFFKYISQTNESDLNFLSRLAKKHNAAFNIKKNTLIFLKQTAEALPLFSFDINKLTSLNIQHLAKVYYNSCSAIYWDTKDNQKISVTVGSEEPKFVIKGFFNTKNEAKTAAASKLQELQKNTIQGSFQLPGQKIYAGGKMRLINPEHSTSTDGSEVTFTTAQQETILPLASLQSQPSFYPETSGTPPLPNPSTEVIGTPPLPNVSSEVIEAEAIVYLVKSIQHTINPTSWRINVTFSG